ncbi:orotidine 5''-phosphate decarboxylase, subfamily 1 [Beggiatoa alba B18LD]|uniref:Orotidine 5'-phosphate decarboxylase n=1 Tax=Beggiatoa alba B18LD TaxID=395493 RepID=I3CGD0_9GAMM|nr:orotidine-5'-phosphate decarboxylase [Beggiatoa alba]EIJ42673.1 orotidine 5''-phosphate decarboxylase, subfamily 1 [Beggiatoa alba B18LD]
MVNNTAALIVALDYPEAKPALALAEQLKSTGCRLKVGMELFTHAGPALVEKLVSQGFDVFLDLKFHDIPNTVAGAVKAAAELGVWMVNVHALGGRDMLIAAREALAPYSQRPLLIAVSILTSLDNTDLYAMGLHGSLTDNVLRLARLTETNGLDGLVCSPHEISLIRQSVSTQLQLVTPGIRPQQSQQDDQKRIMTPQEALQLGANYLVIGRPITRAPDPLQALQTIAQSLTA